MRRRQQPVHYPRECIRGTILRERVDFFGSWRETDQIERRAPDQITLFSHLAGPESTLFQLGEDEAIDRCFGEQRVMNLRRRRLPYRLKRPEGALLGRDDIAFLDRGRL